MTAQRCEACSLSWARLAQVRPQGTAIGGGQAVAGHVARDDDVGRVDAGAQQLAQGLFIVARGRPATPGCRAGQPIGIQRGAEGSGRGRPRQQWRRCAGRMAVGTTTRTRRQICSVTSDTACQGQLTSEELAAAFNVCRGCERSRKRPGRQAHQRSNSRQERARQLVNRLLAGIATYAVVPGKRQRSCITAPPPFS